MFRLLIRGLSPVRDELKRIQVTADVSRDQAVADYVAIDAVHALAGGSEPGVLVGRNRDVEIAILRQQQSRRLQRQQDQQTYDERPF